MIAEGIFNLNKPAGMTSHDCVQAVRRLTGVRRVGHTGTLDPMATGVLPICIGRTTRITEYLDLDLKTYRCEMLLGLATQTLDIWGEVTADCREKLLERQRSGKGFTEDQVKRAFAPFSGVVWQTPPKVSAVRVAGKRLYEYARAGETVEIKARQIFIAALTLTGFVPEELKLTFDVVCSKGTYIRSICRDVGEALFCGGVMSGLVRLKSGVFAIEEATTLEALKECTEEQRAALIKPTDFPLVHFGKAIVASAAAVRFMNGSPISEEEAAVEREPVFGNEKPHLPIRDEYRWAYNIYERDAEQRERFLGVAFYNRKDQKFTVDKIFAGREIE